MLVLVKREASENLVTISNNEEFWEYLKTWTFNPRFNFEFLARKAYGLHGRMVRRQLRFPGRVVLQRIIKLEEQRIKDEMMENDEEYEEGPSRPLGLMEREEYADREKITPVLAASRESRTHLASWLPMAMKLTNLDLLYSTNYHGRSLERFYTHTKRAKHSFVLCEVLSGDGKTVVGMYASQPWHASTQVYGDGECFLFRLEPNPKCWKWSPSRTNRQGNVDEQFDNNETALLEQFMVSTRSYISMGGNDDGSCGLRLNEDLTVGESSPAKGFDNEALHGLKSSVFDVGLVEVYGFCRQIDGRAT